MIASVGTENKDYDTFVFLNYFQSLMYLNVKHINFY